VKEAATAGAFAYAGCIHPRGYMGKGNRAGDGSRPRRQPQHAGFAHLL